MFEKTTQDSEADDEAVEESVENQNAALSTATASQTIAYATRITLNTVPSVPPAHHQL